MSRRLLRRIGYAAILTSLAGTVLNAQRPPVQWMRGGQSTSIMPFYLPDGQTLISASADNTIKLWRLSDGVLLRTTVPFTGGTNNPVSAAVSNDGSLIAITGSDSDGVIRLKVFRTSDGSLTASYTVASLGLGFAFTPDGQQVALGSSSSTDPAKLLPSYGGTPVAMSYTGAPNVIWSGGLAFSPAGSLAMDRGVGQDIAIYPGTGPWSKNTLISSFGFGSAIGPNQFSPDGRFIANISGLIKVWATSAGCVVTAQPEPNWSCAVPPSLFAAGVPYGGTVRFSPDSSRMAFADFGTPGGVNFGMYSTSNGTNWPLLWKAPLESQDFAAIPGFSPDGATVAGGTSIRIGQWRASDGTYLGDVTSHNAPVTAVAWSRDNQFVATGANGVTVLALGRIAPATARIWDSATGALLSTITLPVGDSTVLSGVAFSIDNQTLAVSYWNGSGGGYPLNNLDFYRTSDGSLLSRVSGGGTVAVSPDGTVIAVPVADPSYGNFGALRLYRMSDFALLCEIPGSFNGYGVAFSPDSQYVFASGGVPGGYTVSVYQYRASDGAFVRSFTSSPSVVFSRIAISPDGQTLAAANGDASLSPAYPGTFLFRISDGTQLAAWNANIYGVRGLIFSPDGQYLASGGDDAVLNFYRVSDGTVVAGYNQETGSARPDLGAQWINIRDLQWSPDGSRLLYARTDSTAVMMATPIPYLSAVSAPSPIVSGTTVNGSVSVTRSALPGGFTVKLTSSSPKLAVPASVIVAEGAAAAAFSVTAGRVAVPTPVTLTATARSVSKTATVTINPSRPLWLASVSVASAKVIGGTSSTGAVTLNTAAPAGGATIALSSTGTQATVPGSVTVPQGSSSATFPINTVAVTAKIAANIRGTFGGGTLRARLTIYPPVLASVLLSPASVTGGKTTASNTVRLTGVAPAGGITVALTSADPVTASVPATVVVPGGASTATFSVATAYVTTATPLQISASFNGVTRNATLTVNPLAVVAVNLSAPASTRGTTVFGNRVVLNGPAPPGGAIVTLSSSDTSVAAVSATVTVPAAATTVSFGIRIFPVVSPRVAAIGAAYGSSAASASLTVNP